MAEVRAGTALNTVLYIYALLTASQIADYFHFALPIWGTVGVKKVMLPHHGLVSDVGALPGVPGNPGLALAGDEAPVDGADPVFAGDGENGVKGAADVAGHVLGADEGAVELLEELHMSFKVLGPAVVVKADDVGLLDQ